MNNQEMAEYFLTIADLLEIKGDGIYRVLAYRRAGEALGSLGRDIRDLWEEDRLKDIPGVGTAIASKIDELLRTGRMEFYDRLTGEIPPGLAELLKVSDVGPKKAARFWKDLGISSVEELEAAAHDGKLRILQGIGERSERRILESILALKERRTDRVLIGNAWQVAERLLESLRKTPGVVAAEPAGSLRRWRETIGDLDLIAAAEDPKSVMEAFTALPIIRRVRSKGDLKLSVELVDGMQVQLWVHPSDRFGSAWQYATGSQAHNIRLRERAHDAGLSLSEHGFRRDDGAEILCSNEVEVYQTLGLTWIPPALREGWGEVEAAAEGQLPKLVELDDLVGELHVHTDWSDGTTSILAMAEAAVALGMEYLGISDHSRSLGVARGLSIELLREQRKKISEVQEILGDDIRLLQGAEVEILADGRLDYPDEVLAELDIVIASIHTSLRQPREKITARLIEAIRNPHVDIIGHPSGRLIFSRDPADLDMEAIFQTAAESGVVLEINANPERLDLKDVHARRAVEIGCLLAINTDAHHPDRLTMQKFGVGVARRAWVSSPSVINTWPVHRVLDWLQLRG